MYELPQTLLHLTGPTLQGGPFVGSKLWRTPNTDRQPVHTTHTLASFWSTKYWYNHAAGNRLSLFIIYLLPRNLPLPDAFYCHAPHGGPASNIVFMYVYGRRIMHAVSGRAAGHLGHVSYTTSLSPPFHYFVRNTYWTDKPLLFVCCIFLA